jgi:hypothetical protein
VSRQHHFEGRTPFLLIFFGCGFAALGFLSSLLGLAVWPGTLPISGGPIFKLAKQPAPLLDASNPFNNAQIATPVSWANSNCTSTTMYFEVNTGGSIITTGSFFMWTDGLNQNLEPPTVG